MNHLPVAQQAPRHNYRHTPHPAMVLAGGGPTTAGMRCASPTTQQPPLTTHTHTTSAHHTGMRWPHHSWREMHQSLMFSSQWLYTWGVKEFGGGADE